MRIRKKDSRSNTSRESNFIITLSKIAPLFKEKGLQKYYICWNGFIVVLR